MPAFDQIAELYDETRGGEQRGDEYAAYVAAHLPAGRGPVLEVGVGTGVVALGLVKLGRRLVGVDVSAPMARRAHDRLGGVVALGDAAALPMASGSVAHAVSVWVIQAVGDPGAVFGEVSRVLRPGGTYVVCTTQFPTDDDPIGGIIHRMGDAVAARSANARPRQLTARQILGWATRPASAARSIRSCTSGPRRPAASSKPLSAGPGRPCASSTRRPSKRSPDRRSKPCWRCHPGRASVA
jgi:ubiquinone/menaquinone biosynthesis C-methylase UbiE